MKKRLTSCTIILKMYQQLIERLFTLNVMGGMKLGLTNCLKVQTLLDFPDRSFTSIHIAGTNGKGSVTTKIAMALQHAGYRVGLYTSPHISCFRERIRVNGEMISEKVVEKLLPSLFSLIERHHIPATFFEVTTFLAFLHFAQEKVDFAVLETGLGGRLDATNVACPVLSIITSISLDHTEILGTTLEAIAKEKAGIIKPGTPVIIGPQTPQALLQEIAQQLGSPCITLASQPLLFEEENCFIAQTALNQLAKQFVISPQAIEKGLKANQPCRFEVLTLSQPVILDVAHNPDGLQHLFDTVRSRFPDRSVRVVFGLSKSKDIAHCLQILSQQGDSFHIVEATNGRGTSRELLLQGLKDLKIDPSRLFTHATIREGVEKALQEAREHQQILVICGSFFIMSQARRALGIEEPCDEIDLNERDSRNKTG